MEEALAAAFSSSSTTAAAVAGRLLAEALGISIVCFLLYER